MTLKTFLYHRIKAPSGRDVLLENVLKYRWCVSPSDFEMQIKQLRKKYRFISAEDFMGNKIPKNAALLTFDDGYSDFYTNAFPLLKKYEIPAAVFLVSGHVGTRKPFWWDEIISCIYNTGAKEFEGFKLEYLDGKSEFIRQLLIRFTEINEGEKLRRIESLKKALSGERIIGENLHWSEILEMKDRGIYFGSHSISHPVLTKISESDMRTELVRSKIHIERKIKEDVRLFAYPNGIHSEKVKGALKKAGYVAAFTASESTSNLYGDMFGIGRSLPQRNANYSFSNITKKKISTFYAMLGGLRVKTRRDKVNIVIGFREVNNERFSLFLQPVP